MGSFTVLASAFIAKPLIKVAFGQAYLGNAVGFDLTSAAWIFALSGAIQALVQLALLDAIARRSAVIGWTVLGSIAVEFLVIATVAHHSPVQLITTAAGVSSVVALAGLLIALRSKSPASAPRPAGTTTELAPATP
jgi:hypothetical protein